MRPRTETGSSTGSIPKTRTEPVSARHSPRICLIRVDLPAPFSPTRPKTLPDGTLSVTSFNAGLEPNLRDSLLTATTGSCIFFPCRLAGAAACQFGFHEPAYFLFVQVESREAIQRGLNDGLCF